MKIVYTKRVVVVVLLVFLACNATAFSQPIWQWAKQDSLNIGLAGKVEVSAIHANFNTLVSGYFADSALFDTIKLVAEYPHWGNNVQGFVAKINNNGKYVWIKKTTHTSANSLSMVTKAVEANNGKVYLIGQFINTIQLDTFTLSEPNSKGVFMAELDVLGNVTWAKKIAIMPLNTNGFVTTAIKDFEVDNKNGLVYFCGSFSDSINVSGTTFYAGPSFGTSEAFIAQFDVQGNYNWLKKSISVHNNFVYSNSTFYGIEADLNGNMYACGAFNADMFGINNQLFYLKRPSNNITLDDYNGLILALDSSGNSLWSKQTFRKNWVEDIKVDNMNNAVYVTGKMIDDSCFFDSNSLYPTLVNNTGLVAGDFVFFG
ncbi:MAG: hypothetical protein J0M08_03365 [Bacteroidetes bacterium]|nr:hypothetical protein [Bacteroidota bacterium]